MSFPIDQQILRLEIPIDDILLMHIADGQQNLADVEHGDIVAKPSILAESVEQLPSRAKLEDHVDEGIILKGSFE